MTKMEREAYIQFVASMLEDADTGTIKIIYETMLAGDNNALKDCLYALVHMDTQKQERVRWYISKIQ